MSSAAREVVIVDGGGANIASLKLALQRLGCTGTLTSDAATIRAASHVILPGVGAARAAMERLQKAGLDTLIPTLRQPVLGICLGLQLLFESSEEDDVACLGILPGRVRRFTPAPDRPIPHMGWNQIRRRRESPLLDGCSRRQLFLLRAQLCRRHLGVHDRDGRLRLAVHGGCRPG